MKQPESKTMTIYGLRSEPVAALTRNLPKDVEQYAAQLRAATQLLKLAGQQNECTHAE